MPHYTNEEVKYNYKKAKDYANKYIYSEGFNERYNKFHPKGKFRQSLKNIQFPKLFIQKGEGSHYNIDNGNIYIDPEQDYIYDRHGYDIYDLYNKYGITEFPRGTVETHELGHHLDRELGKRTNYNHSIIGWILDNFETSNPKHSSFYPQLTPTKNINDHDKDRSENWSDLLDYRRLLDENKIYDSTKANNHFTKQHLNKSKEVFKDDFIRIFNTFTDDEIINIMNTVAQNNNKKRSLETDINYT